MTNDELSDLFDRFERRLSNLAAQAYQTCEQAKRTHEQLDRLLREVAHLKEDILTDSDTGVYRSASVRPGSSPAGQGARRAGERTGEIGAGSRPAPVRVP